MPVDKNGVVYHVCNDSGDEKVWTCRLSGKSDLTFDEAKDSEESLRKVLQFEFADEWEGIALKRIHHSRLDIERLASKCLKTLENEKIEVGESVWYKAKADGAERPCKVIQVLENTPSKKSDSLYSYDLIRTDTDQEMMGVARSKLIRSIPMPTLELMKVFIRAHSAPFKNDTEMPWVVDEPYRAIHSIESKLDLEQVWKLKKEGASRKSIQTLLTDSPAYKRKADDSDMPAPAAKKQKVTKKRANKETSKEKQQKNGKKKQGSIFDHFKPATVEENGESKPKYAQKLIDMIELAKSLVPNRSTSDEYWETTGKLSTAVCMNGTTYRDDLLEFTKCPDTVKDDIIGRMQIKRLTQQTKGSRLKAIKGMRPLPDFLPLSEIFDQSLLDFLSKHSIPILTDIYSDLHLPNSESIPTNWQYHRHIVGKVHKILEGDELESSAFWYGLIINYMNDNALKLPKRTSFNYFTFNALSVTATTLRTLPQRCFPYLVNWYQTEPIDRMEILLERVEFLCGSEFLADIFEQWRTTPLGVDRQGRIYWMFYFSSFIYVENPKTQKWQVMNDMGQVRNLIQCLDDRHIDEYRLKTEFVEQKDEITEMLTEWNESVARESEPEPELRRSTRKQQKEDQENEEERNKTIEDILAEEVVHVAKRLYDGQLGVEDDADTIECLVDSARESLKSMGTTMLRFISVIPHNNLNDHMWNGKEFPAFIKRVNDAETTVDLCFYWAMFNNKVKWENFDKRKEIRLPSRASSRSTRTRVNYAEVDEKDTKRRRKTSSEEENDAILKELKQFERQSRFPTRSSARLMNQI